MTCKEQRSGASPKCIFYLGNGNCGHSYGDTDMPTGQSRYVEYPRVQCGAYKASYKNLWFIKGKTLTFSNPLLQFELRDVSLFFQLGRSRDYCTDEECKATHKRIMKILQKRYKMYLPYKG